MVLLAATVAIGTEVNGARLWIRFGGYQIQPGEFAKVLLVVFIAGYLRENREVLERPARRVAGVGLPALKHLLPLLAMWGIALVLLVACANAANLLLARAQCSTVRVSAAAARDSTGRARPECAAPIHAFRRRPECRVARSVLRQRRPRHLPARTRRPA